MSLHMPTPREPSLCLDILVSLFDLLHKRSDVVALASTCKIMNALGSKRLLAMGVEIEDDDALVSFCRFMLADLERRGPQLRKLTVSIEIEPPDQDEWGSTGLDPPSDDEEWETDIDPDADDVDVETEIKSEFGDGEPQISGLDGPRLLARVLRGATRLEDLDMDCTDELIQCGGEDLRRALVSLPALRRLRTATLGLSTLSVVRGMAAPLVEIDLNLQYFNMVAFADIFDVLKLPAFRSTLEKITVWYADLGGRGFIWDKLEEKDRPRFPRVHTLAVRFIDHGIHLSALMDAFPNLRTLDLTDTDPDGDDLDVFAEHARNRAVSVGNSWKSLTNLCGDTDALYALGLVRPVPRLDVSDVRLMHQGVTRLHAVICGTMPSRLLLHIDQELDSFEAYAALPYLFPPMAAEWITHLALDFNAAPGDAVWRMMSAFEHRNYNFLAPLTSLQCLVIRIGDDEILDGDPPDPPGTPSFTLQTPTLRLMAAYACLILRRFPRLLLVTLDLAAEGLGPQGTSHTFWKQSFATGTGIAARTWRGVGPGDVSPWTVGQGLQWHRRLAYPEPPESY